MEPKIMRIRQRRIARVIASQVSTVVTLFTVFGYFVYRIPHQALEVLEAGWHSLFVTYVSVRFGLELSGIVNGPGAGPQDRRAIAWPLVAIGLLAPITALAIVCSNFIGFWAELIDMCFKLTGHSHLLFAVLLYVFGMRARRTFGRQLLSLAIVVTITAASAAPLLWTDADDVAIAIGAIIFITGLVLVPFCFAMTWRGNREALTLEHATLKTQHIEAAAGQLSVARVETNGGALSVPDEPGALSHARSTEPTTREPAST